MTDQQIIDEFKQFELDQYQIATIRGLYNGMARFLIETLGNTKARDPKILKLSLNSMKFTIVQVLEMGNEERKNTFSNS